MENQREIQYPQFLECCQYTSEIYWRNIFKEMAYGKPPFGTYFNDGFFCCAFKKKRFSYNLDCDDSEKLFNDIHALLSSKLGMMSSADKKNRRQRFQQLQESIVAGRETWSSIRSKQNFKTLLLEKFVIDRRIEFHLSVQQSQELLAFILIAIAFKVIAATEINYNGTRILDIQGITFSPGQIHLAKSIFDFRVTARIEIESEPERMTEHWEKYLTALRKLCQVRGVEVR